MNNKMKLIGGFLGLCFLAACSDDSALSKDVTDSYAVRLLNNNPKPENLIGSYYIIEHKEGTDIGIIFVDGIESDKDVNTGVTKTCVTYNAFKRTPEGREAFGNETLSGTVCTFE